MRYANLPDDSIHPFQVTNDLAGSRLVTSALSHATLRRGSPFAGTMEQRSDSAVVNATRMYD